MLINTTIYYHQNLVTIIFWNNEQIRIRIRDRKNEIDSERFSQVDRNGEDMFLAEYISYDYIVYGEGRDYDYIIIIFAYGELPAKF